MHHWPPSVTSQQTLRHMLAVMEAHSDSADNADDFARW